MILAKRNAIITGSSQGFGYAIAERYVKEGASVIICSRDLNKLEEAKENLKQLAGNGQKVISVQADVSVEHEVNRLVKIAIEQLGRVDILVNNAGIYGPKGPIEVIDWKEWTKAIEINLYGVVLMCKEILPHMKKNSYGKIINLSGGGATSPMPGISAYAASKAAVVRFTETLAGECSDCHIDVNSVAPGALNTRLLEEVLAAGPENVGWDFYEKSLKQKESGGASLEKGAGLCTYLGSHESDGLTGKLISALWDPWSEFSKYNEVLQNSDIYTLRRIVPEDRGEKWG